MKNVININFIKQKNKFKKNDSVIEKDFDKILNKKFKEKFFADDNTDLKNESIRELIKVRIKQMFIESDKRAIINFINAIYNDSWFLNQTELLSSTEHKNNIILILNNQYQTIKYTISINVRDLDNIAVTVFRDILSSNNENIINLFSNKNKIELQNKLKIICNNNPYLLVFCTNMCIPDVLEDSSNEESEFFYKYNIFKGWKYDFKQLYEMKAYILFPMKIFDLQKRIKNISCKIKNKGLIDYEISYFFKEINRYLLKLKNEGYLSEKGIQNINILCFEFLKCINENIDTSKIREGILKQYI